MVKMNRIFKFFTVMAVAGCLVGGHAWAEEGKIKEAGEDPNKPRYVKISPLLLPVIGDKGIEQIVSIVIVIETPNKAAADEVIQRSPRLNDAFLTDLYGALDRRDKMVNGLLNIANIKDRLTQISQKILGDDNFKSILIQGVSQRPV